MIMRMKHIKLLTDIGNRDHTECYDTNPACTLYTPA